MALTLCDDVGNNSLLRWWFRDQSSSLRTESSLLQATLSLSSDHRVWLINIAGSPLSVHHRQFK